ncbi:MAG: S-layer homology domain-containing protein, partial [Oliverpabstia sp.]
ATATLNITVYDSATYDAENEEDRTVLLETTAEKEGPKGDTYAFTAEDIKKAVGEIEGYTLDEDSLPTEEKYPTAVYGGEAGTVDVTATEIPTGDGHTYIKFNETYYTKNNSGNWQTGTSYVCIDCGHAFELEDDETVEDHLRSNDKVLTDDEVKSYAGKTTEVWTWSTDKTEASMYTVPTDLKDHKFDCIWENPSLSTREVATVSGDCTTGKFTAKLKNGTTESASVTAGNHSYQNQEKKDDAGNVTQEAAVQWTWADDLSTATVRFLCDVCGKTLEKTVTQEEMTSSETEDGLIKYTATVTVDDVNYISSREYNPNPFEDVAKDSYYYDAVLWAVKNDITSGKDETHFAPNDDCTRAQVVTFLWRAMDEPEPKTTENPFVDVKEDKYYYKAVLWAAENGITSGIDETHFAPNDTVTRGQFVTFLHRNEGEPKPNITENPFVDVNESKYYYDAVLWAYENEITKGTDETHFKPESGCTRGQVVTFLYRAYGDEE